MFLNKTRTTALAAVIAAATLGAGLVAPAASAADSGEKTVSDATFAWSLNKESNYNAYAPGTVNFLSAGIVDKTSASDNVEESEWKQSDGNASIEKQQADGSYAAATWAGLRTTPSGDPLPSVFTTPNGPDSGNRVKLTKGTGTIDADKDDASISWDGAFTVVYYSGMTQWYAKDVKLNVTGGKGTVTATLGGWGSSMDDPNKYEKLTEEQNVEIATLSNVDVKDDGTVVTPDYNEIDVAGNGTKVKSWPKPFVDFVTKVGAGPYWYASGVSGDVRKAPTAITVGYTAEAPEPPATAPEAPAKPTIAASGDMKDPYQVKVDWKAPNDGGSAITGYTVTLTPSTGDAVTQDVAADATTATFGKLTAQNVSYTATVVAKNDKGASAASPASDAVTPNADPTSTPTVTVTPTKDIDPAVENTFTVTGTGFTGGAAAYGTYAFVIDSSIWKPGQVFEVAYAKQVAGVSWVQPTDIKDGKFTATVKVDAGKLAYGKTYVAGTVAAHGLAPTDRRLDTAQAITLKAQIPTAPSDVAIAKTGDADATVGWKAPAAGTYDSKVAKYTVVVSDKDGKQVDTQTADAVDGQADYAATFAGIAKPGTTLTATVTAVDANGQQSAAVKAAADLVVETTAPSAPRNVTVKQGAAHQLTVGWAAPADNGGADITGYTVTLTPAAGDAKTTTVKADTLQATFDDLDPNTAYTASVVATNAKGDSAAGTSDANAPVKPAPIAPALAFADSDKKEITTLTLNVNDTTTVYALAQGEQVVGNDVTWETSDKTVVGFPADEADTPATAEIGYDAKTLVAGEAGKATITISATIDGQKVSKTLAVTVKDPNAGGDTGNGDNNGNGSTNGDTTDKTTGMTDADGKTNADGTTNGQLGKTGASVAVFAAIVVALAAAAAGVTVLRRRNA